MNNEITQAAGDNLFLVTPGDEPGMNLRDYFAIHGPEPTKQQVEDYMTGWTTLDCRLARAQLRYLEADAMLAARAA